MFGYAYNVRDKFQYVLIESHQRTIKEAPN